MNCPTQAQKGKAMHILIVEPGKHPRLADIDDSLESLQKTVGGYIEAIYPLNPQNLKCFRLKNIPILR